MPSSPSEATPTSPIRRKINNSYETEPSSSSGNSNGSSIDTLTMGNHNLDDDDDDPDSPNRRLNVLLGLGGRVATAGTGGVPMTPLVESPQTPDTTNATTGSAESSGGILSGHRQQRNSISEAADRERVELAKINFQRVFVVSQQQQQQMRAATEAHNPTHADHGADGEPNLTKIYFERRFADSRQQQHIIQAATQAHTSTNADHDDHGTSKSSTADDDDDDDDDLSNVSVYSIEPSSSRNDDNDGDDETTTTDTITHVEVAAQLAACPMQTPCGYEIATTTTTATPSTLDKNTNSDQKPTVFVAENSCNAVDHQIANPQNAAAAVAAAASLSSSLTLCVQSQQRQITSFNGCLPRAPPMLEQQQLSLLAEVERRSACMQANNELSPDLFAEELDDDDDDDNDDDAANTDDNDADVFVERHETDAELPDKRDHIHASEKRILNRIQTSLSGVLPPPSVTILQYDILEMLSMYKQNIGRALSDPPAVLGCVDGSSSEFRPTHSVAELNALAWPECQDAKAHGLHYNRSEVTESIEVLCMRYAERNIGAETASTFTYTSPSSCKKRSLRLKQLTKSPGNRLSHLARRRAIFSSANLLKPNPNDASKLGKNQLCIDTRSRERRGRKVRTPKRRTPARKVRTPGRKTPGSSRKRLVFGGGIGVGAGVAGAPMVCTSVAAATTNSSSNYAVVAGGPAATIKPLVPATRETSKRALFQSPPAEKPRPQIPAELAHRVERSKRVLFSPLPADHTSSPDGPNLGSSAGGNALRKQISFGGCSSSIDAFQAPPKRKRDTDNETPTQLHGHTAKMARYGSVAAINLDNLTPRTARLAKSQSFSVQVAVSGGEFRDATGLQRAASEQTISSAPLLTDLHKKKIFWATATALKNKRIASQHANYKQYASVLAKVIKRFYLELPNRRSEGTSAAMLKIAEKHVFWVLQGKSEDEIYLSEKQRTEQQMAAKPAKFTGYVAPEEYDRRQSLLTRSTSNLFGTSDSSGFGNASQSLSTSSLSSIGDVSSLFGSQTQSQQSVQTTQSQKNSLTASQIVAAATDEAKGDPCTMHRLLMSASKTQSRPPLHNNGNSTSKSNTKTGVLRENDQRQRSGQKGVGHHNNAESTTFSGRDQKNVSPYGGGGAARLGSLGKQHTTTTLLTGVGANIMKAKRQISFDN